MSPRSRHRERLGGSLASDVCSRPEGATLAALGGVLAVVLAALGATVLVRWLGSLGEPARLPEPAQVPFLGGTQPPTHAWGRFHAHYDVVALVFVTFEMEMMFMYPRPVAPTSPGSADPAAGRPCSWPSS
ncbi:MAG: NADH-quinone oxidoreductase subunit A [Nitriliruptorales bacterium]